MAAFMPQEHLAPIGSATFDLQHLVQFKSPETWMGKVKGY
jgi:hypothetical protein